MSDDEQARRLLYVTAQAVKAFLAAFEPLEHGLTDLVRSGYAVRVFVTAEHQADAGSPITYLIEMGGEAGDPGQEWTAEDEAFLRTLRLSVEAGRPRRHADDGAGG